MIAERIRKFFDTLFPDALVNQLRADLEEARKERDYFKGVATRLELVLTSPREARHLSATPSVPDREQPKVQGRKMWAQVVAERREELRKKATENAGKPPAKGVN